MSPRPDPAPFPAPSTGLPAGVRLIPLARHRDARGSFTEVFRAAWLGETGFPQWNLVRSEAGTLRGVHLHPRHDDYLLVVEGRALVGLRDLRAGTPGHGSGAMVTLDAETATALFIPHGVAHGFYFAAPALHLYGVTEYWSPADELGCRFDDPVLNLPWPCARPILSPRDRDAPSLARMLALAGAGP